MRTKIYKITLTMVILSKLMCPKSSTTPLLSVALYLLTSNHSFKQTAPRRTKKGKPNIENATEQHQVSLRHGVFFEPEPKHGGSFSSQETGLRRVIVRNWCAR